jgi:hypothetical protein
MAVFWLLYVVWRSPHRSDLAAYGAFAVAVVALAAGWIASAWRRARPSPAGGGIEGEDLDRVADLLAQAVRKQWDLAAGERGLAGADPIAVTWGRPSLSLAGPAAAAADSLRFAPLPGLAAAGEAQLAAGQISDLHAVYGGLGSGRLVVAGPAGSGKSGAAVLLVLAALQYRGERPAADRPKVPVPVLFTAQDWDPRRQPVADWLTERLQETYPLFTGTAGAAYAAGLIATGKIAVILDGLDEIATGLRPIALEALSQQASFRLVVLSRTAEMASAAAHHGVLHGAAAIELRAIDPAAAASYLERVQLDPSPEGWRDLVKRIRSSPESPLSAALDSPLALTLVRDTYQSGDDARELLDFCDTTQQDASVDQITGAITDHLLDRVLPAAYAHRPGRPPPRYALPTAQNALTKIAARMNQDGTRDLQWWRIPAWAPPAQRFVMGSLVIGLVIGLAVGLVGGLVAWLGFARWIAIALAAELGLGLGSGLLLAGLVMLAGRRSESPRRIGKLQLRRVLSRDTLVVTLLVAPGSGLELGLVGGLVLGLAPKPVTGLVRLADGFVGGLAFAAGFGPASSKAWSASLAAAQLARQWHTPMHLMRFLDDARERNVLRTVGPAYQFRHARLQDRLAAATTEKAAPQAASKLTGTPAATADHEY